jgi:hypothetical protein
MSTTEKYFKIKNGLQFDDGTTLTTAPAGGSFSGSYNDLTDKPTIPSTTGLATESFVSTAISNLVDTAPVTLDTLNELAAALGDDPNFATTVTTALGNKANTSSLATVATSGSYNDLTNKPTVPTNLDSLSDVILTSILMDNTLTYDGSNWVNVLPKKVWATTSTSNTEYSLLFTSAPAQAVNVLTNTSLTINPSTGTITATKFAGAHNGSVGATTPSTGAFTTLSASSTVSLSPSNASVTLSPTGTGTLTVNPATAGTINNMSIGATTASTGRFTNLTVSGTVTAGGGVGTSGQVLQSTGTGVQWAAASGGGNNIILLHSGQEYITIGQTGTTESWTLATAGGISGVSVSTNTFTLPAGNYFLELPYTFSNGTSGYDFYLRNVTDSVNTGTITSNTSSLSGVSKYVYWGFQIHFTIAASKVFRFQTGTTNSFQANMGYTANGKYTVKIIKY